jgi:hypothetical protein
VTTTQEWEARIIKQSGMEREQIIEAGEHGAGAGWPGFTYTQDCVDFVKEYRKDVWDTLYDDAQDFGYENVAAFVASFNSADMADTADGFDNLLAWYMLEKIGHELADMDEEDEEA